MLAWTAREGARTGYLPWEKLVLMGGFMLPLFSRGIATGIGMPVGPPVLLAVFIVVVRRACVTRCANQLLGDRNPSCAEAS